LAEKQLALLKQVYAARARAFVGALEGELSAVEGCSFNIPSGGYFVWMQLPFEAELLKAVEEEHGVVVKAGSAFSCGEGTTASSCSVRLCFARLDEALLVEGAARLGAAVRRVVSSSEPLVHAVSSKV
jgi:DNA-binding transcriptional MocR family regulator